MADGTPGDGILTSAEIGGAASLNVDIGVPAGLIAGDTIAVTINGVAQPPHIVTAADLAAGHFTVTAPTPPAGSTLTVTATATNANGTSAVGSDSATV